MSNNGKNNTAGDKERSKELQKLKPEVRWTKIFETMMGCPGELNVTRVAKELNVNRRTLYYDFDNPRFREFIREKLQDHIDHNLMTSAFEVITNAIMNDKCLKTSKWLVENFMDVKKVNRYPENQDSSDAEIIDGEFIEISENMNGNSPEVLDLINQLRRAIEAPDKSKDEPEPETESETE